MQHESCEWTREKDICGSMCGLSSEQKCSLFFFFHIKQLGMHCLKLGDDITKALQREVEPNTTKTSSG